MAVTVSTEVLSSRHKAPGVPHKPTPDYLYLKDSAPIDIMTASYRKDCANVTDHN